MGYVAVTTGTPPRLLASDGGRVRLEALLTTDTVRGVDNGCYATTFPVAMPAPPLVVGHLVRHDEGDGGWLRRCALTATSVSLNVDEDVTYDAERAHTTEMAGVVVVGVPVRGGPGRQLGQAHGRPGQRRRLGGRGRADLLRAPGRGGWGAGVGDRDRGGRKRDSGRGPSHR